jgi:hypothetical protein
VTNQLLQPTWCAPLLQTMMPADRRRWMLNQIQQPSIRATSPNGMCVILPPKRRGRGPARGCVQRQEPAPPAPAAPAGGPDDTEIIKQLVCLQAI